MGFEELFDACLAEDNDKVKDILATGDDDINKYGRANNGHDFTPLILAMDKGNAEIVRTLLSYKNTELDLVEENNDYYNETGLHRACYQTNHLDWMECVKLFINDERCTPEVLNMKNNREESALYIATEYGPAEFVKILAEMPGIDVNTKSVSKKIGPDGRILRRYYTPLLYAMEHDMPDKVRALLDNKNTKLDGSMASMMVSNVHSYKRIECIKLFTADERCTAEIVNHKDGSTPLRKAVEGGHADIVKILAGHAFTDFKIVDEDGKTLIDAATENGDKDVVQIVKLRIAIQEAKKEDKNGKMWELLDDLNKIETNIELYIACENGDNDKVKEILAKGYVDINKKASWNGRTSLSVAMKKGKGEVVRTLLANKNTKMDLVDNNNETGLHLAHHFDVDFKECIQLFISDERCTPEVLNLKNNKEESALHIATKYGATEIVQMLTEHSGIDVNCRDESGYTPLLRAMNNGNPDTVKVLLANKNTKLDLVDDEKKNCLHRAVWMYIHYKCYKSLECIRVVTADERCTSDIVNTKDKDGRSPLMKAVKAGNEDLVYFLAKLADFKSTDNDGKTVMDAAIERGDENIVQIVEERIAFQEEKKGGKMKN